MNLPTKYELKMLRNGLSSKTKKLIRELYEVSPDVGTSVLNKIIRKKGGKQSDKDSIKS